MKLQKRGPTLLLIFAIAIVCLLFLLQRKQRVIASQAEPSEAEILAGLAQEVRDIDTEILSMREAKKLNCELLGDRVPFDLLESCGKPKQK